MTTLNFAALTQKANDAGFDTTELEPGRHDVECVNANFTTKTNGKSQFGFRFKVIAGPFAGQGIWKNLNVPTDESKPVAVSIFLRECRELGLDTQLAEANPDEAAKKVIGSRFDIQVKRDRVKSGGGFWEDVNIMGAPQTVAPAMNSAPVAPPVTSGMPPAQPVVPAWQQESRPV